MTYAHNFDQVGAHTYRDRVLAVFGNPALHHLGRTLPSTRSGGRGPRVVHPPLLQFAVAVCARIYGSQNRALKELSDGTLWRDACAVFAEQTPTPTPLPTAPPTARQQDGFIGWLATTQVNGEPLLDRLSEAFTKTAVRQAELLGNFAEAGWPDYAKPDIWHTVFGDGTYLKPLSDACWVTNKETGEKTLVGSRAKNPARARVHHVLTDPTEDKKTARGVNHVTLTTWTRYGWVVLGVRHALGAEVHATRDLIASAHDTLGHRLHTVVWDRVIKGRDLQEFMGERRLMILTKQVERASNSKKSDGFTAPVLAPEEALRLHAQGTPLPLGTCVYPRSEPYRPDVTRSYYYSYETFVDGACRHDLWVDDGALVDVIQSEKGWLVKVQHASVLHARPLPGPTFSLDYKFRLPCPQAAEGHHVFHRTWKPRASRPAKAPGRAGYDLVPVPRLQQDLFDLIHGLRNNTESLNAWFKSSLGQHKRAMRVEIEEQRIDHLCSAILANVITWSRYEEADLDEE